MANQGLGGAEIGGNRFEPEPLREGAGQRFLDPAQQAKLFDRAGNAVPTVWIAGRIAGAWGQRDDGRVVTRLFEPVPRAERALLDGEAARLTEFLAGEYLPPRYGTAFTKDREAFG